jgi:serine/threonine protein kinase
MTTSVADAKGTPQYMAPEIMSLLQPAKYSKCSDVYALGLLVFVNEYTMLCYCHILTSVLFTDQ